MMKDTRRIGVIGAGQLSLMLCDSAESLGYAPLVFAQNVNEPACLKHRHQLGSLNSERDLRTFFEQVDIVAFENEFLDCTLLAKASANSTPSFLPPLSSIATVQDKLKQKDLLARLSIPSTEFIVLDKSKPIHDQIPKALGAFGKCVLKWSRMGYDGKGVMILSEENLNDAITFCEKAYLLGSEVYAEQFVPFVRELAFIGVLSINGDFCHYPAVVSEQKNNICSRVFGPAVSLGLPLKIQNEFAFHAEKLARSLSLTGAFAIEMFETSDGRILVNEIAPRVHNSGHYTQDACIVSQFDNHWRALLGLPLGSTVTTPAFAMLNFLGPDENEVQILTSDMNNILPTKGHSSTVHWYAKSEMRRRRKMGHINGTRDNISELEGLLEELNQSQERWFYELNMLSPPVIMEKENEHNFR